MQFTPFSCPSRVKFGEEEPSCHTFREQQHCQSALSEAVPPAPHTRHQTPQPKAESVQGCPAVVLMLIFKEQKHGSLQMSIPRLLHTNYGSAGVQLVVYQPDTSWLSGKRGFNGENASTRMAFSWLMIDVGGPSTLRVVPSLGR